MRYFICMTDDACPAFSDASSPATPSACVSSDVLADLLLHLGRAASAGEAGTRLTSAQWVALRYFSRANSRSCTPSAFASFHSTTRGTASQTVKSLEKAGLIARFRSEDDGRSVRFRVTETGERVLAEDPLKRLVAAIDGVDPATRATLSECLPHLIERVAGSTCQTVFGTCQDCCNLSGPDGTGPRCKCMDLALAPDDMERLCVNFVPRA